LGVGTPYARGEGAAGGENLEAGEEGAKGTGRERAARVTLAGGFDATTVQIEAGQVPRSNGSGVLVLPTSERQVDVVEGSRIGQVLTQLLVLNFLSG
jgi:hypothetical protein